MDEEIKSLAEAALLDGFWHDFSALVNTYMRAAEGLDTQRLEYAVGDKTSVFGRDRKAEGDYSLNVWTQNGDSLFDTTGHETVVEALSFKRATAVHFCGERVFQRSSVDDEWRIATERENE